MRFRSMAHLFVASSLAMALGACGDDGSPPSDAGTEDAGDDCQFQELTSALIAGGKVLEAGTCWEVKQDLSLTDGTLDVREGVQVVFATGRRLSLRNAGRMKVTGTAEKPVYFGSADPLVRWQGISLDDSQGVDNTWSHLRVENAGSGKWSGAQYSGAAVYLTGTTTLSMEHVTIAGSASHGLLAFGEVTFTLANGVFEKNDTPAYLHPETAHGLGGETQFVDNANEYVRVSFANTDTVKSEQTWNALSVPYRIEQRTAIEGKLTLAEGATLEMAQDVSLRVRSSGSLTAVGSTDAPILFRGASAGTRGYWQGIEIAAGGNTPGYGATLDHCRIEDAGSDNWSGAAASLAALYMESASSARITNTTFENSGGYGIWASANARIEGFAKNRFTKNARVALLHPERIGELEADNRVDDNDDDAIEFARSNTDRVSTDASWKNLGVRYRALNRYTVEAALTLEAGVSVEHAQDVGLIVANTGSLTSLGTPEQPVTLSGQNANATGYWMGVRINSNDPKNTLNHTTVSHAGSARWTGDAESSAAIYLSGGAQVSLDTVNLGPGGGYGVFLEAASSQLSCTSVSFETLASGAVFDDDANATLPACP